MADPKHGDYVKIKMFLESIHAIMQPKIIDPDILAEYKEVYNTVYRLVNPA